jgi:hypothetical protein
MAGGGRRQRRCGQQRAQVSHVLRAGVRGMLVGSTLNASCSQWRQQSSSEHGGYCACGKAAAGCRMSVQQHTLSSPPCQDHHRLNVAVADSATEVLLAVLPLLLVLYYWLVLFSCSAVTYCHGRLRLADASVLLPCLALLPILLPGLLLGKQTTGAMPRWMVLSSCTQACEFLSF